MLIYWHVHLLRLLLLLLVVGISLADFQQLSLEYAFAYDADYKQLGIIAIERTYDGNFTGSFIPKADSKVLWQEMADAAKTGVTYRIRTKTTKESIQTFNVPCLMLQAGLAHQFRATIDADQEALLSLSVFPEGLYTADADYQTCSDEGLPLTHQLHGSVAVTRVVALPTPDTESYIQKMEKERQARQHGAQQDNRSWLQKYWMYIVAAFVFMVIMNATAGDQGDQ